LINLSVSRSPMPAIPCRLRRVHTMSTPRTTFDVGQCRGSVDGCPEITVVFKQLSAARLWKASYLNGLIKQSGADLKSVSREGVGVRVPQRAPSSNMARTED
jgi:hypothetical protein